MNTPEIYVVSAARTAIGTFGGSLKDVPPAELATTAVKAALERAAVDPALVGHLVMGNVIPTDTRDAYISRVAAINAGIPKETPAYNVNRLCGSGLQAIINAAQTLMLGDADIAIGAGAESMSRGPYLLPSARWGARMGNVQAIDYMLGILHDPFHGIHMGITAENVAARNGITREMQDALALEDQKRAAHAIANGYFNEQIATVEIQDRKGTKLFSVDEHPRATSLEQLAAMKPAFKKDGSVTAGNASGINDGAAVVLLASEAIARRLERQPMARILGLASAGVEPRVMGIGPVPAVQKLCGRLGLTPGAFDAIELNEAFAAQALACLRGLGLADDAEHVNRHGGAIALGHPLGMSGARLVGSLARQLVASGDRYGLATMCVGVGQGVAMAIERI